MSNEKLLKDLLLKWENSESFKGKENSRRILVKDVSSYYSDYKEKEAFISFIKELKDEGIVDFSWSKSEKGNLIKEVWLASYDEETISKAYSKAKLRRLDEFLKTLEENMDVAINSTSDEKISSFLLALKNKTEQNKKVPRRYFSAEDNDFNKTLLSVVLEIVKDKKEETPRLFSTRVLKDSKEFEKTYKASAIKLIKSAYGFQEESDDDILASFNIVKYPEIIEFKGKFKITFNDSSFVDYTPLKYGAYINSQSVGNIRCIELKAERIMLIENKANYYEYIKSSSDKEAVIFHGGFHSPCKRKFLSLIEDTLSENVSVFHWGDIDLGGFQIFMTVKEVFPSLIPYKMDKKTILSNFDKVQKIEDIFYLDKIKNLIEDDRYIEFKDVLEFLYEARVRLEQESLLL